MEKCPIVLVGMPRSGSTLCSAILNLAPEVYLINDAYFLQEVDKRHAWRQFKSERDAKAFLDKILSLVSRRSGAKRQEGLQNSSRMTEEQLDNAYKLISKIEVQGRAWHAILQDAMINASESAGNTKWGWNTPQDIYHIEKIGNAFPDSRFIFMMREPFAVLKSFKNKPNIKAARRYHPLAQALAWKKAVKIFDSVNFAYPSRVLLIKYEDLVSNPVQQIARINSFLNISIPTNVELGLLGTNSSYRKKARSGDTKNMEVSGIESWLADSVFHYQRDSLGYSSQQKSFSLHGGCDLLTQTFKFINYYCVEFFTNSDIRKRIFRFLK